MNIVRIPRRRWLFFWGIVLLVIVGGAFIGARHLLRRTKPPEISAVPFVNLDGHDEQVVIAIQRAQAGAKLAPRSGAAWGTYGAVLMAHQFYREALGCFAEAEQLEPVEPHWPYLQAIILLSSDPDAALPKLVRAVELFGDSPPAPKLRLAHFLIERGRIDEAEIHLQSVLQKHPDEPQALLGMGKAALARGQLKEALNALERSAQSPLTMRASIALIATIQQRLGNPAGAEEAARRVATLPNDPPLQDPFIGEIWEQRAGMQAALTRADAMRTGGRLREALVLFEQTVARYPDAPIAWQLLGQARIDAKEYPAAVAALRKAIELSPNAESFFQLGSAYFLQNDLEPAIQAFQRSVALRPTYAPGHHNLGICLARSERRVEAIERFKEAVRLAPGFSDAHRWLGGTLALERRYEESLQALKRAMELNPQDSVAAQMLERATVRAKEADLNVVD